MGNFKIFCRFGFVVSKMSWMPMFTNLLMLLVKGQQVILLYLIIAQNLSNLVSLNLEQDKLHDL